ncbi:hypothetical protein FIBSPDRAFT_891406 [Athelia psychrophila]|uniref:Uncharacterized protein n=1 Tax=Athelia psychrophila TaxID=1759441 RepID=A0A166JM76_9AGAM|nr:hypothetical protein FIBSPDRAFT_891406 [Fibularhizoctonia sp. CBS 109695]
MSGQVALFSPLFDLASSGWPVLLSRISVRLSRTALKTPLIALLHLHNHIVMPAWDTKDEVMFLHVVLHPAVQCPHSFSRLRCTWVIFWEIMKTVKGEAKTCMEPALDGTRVMIPTGLCKMVQKLADAGKAGPTNQGMVSLHQILANDNYTTNGTNWIINYKAQVVTKAMPSNHMFPIKHQQYNNKVPDHLQCVITTITLWPEVFITLKCSL